MIQIGETIPDFELDAYHNDNLVKIKLADYRGKWLILLFYPADFTFVCPTELKEAADSYIEIQKLGAELLSISTDTAYAHKAWHDSSAAISKIQYPMLADPVGQMCREFGTLIEKEGLARRTTYIINPEGKVVAVDMHDNSIGRSITEILRKLQAAQYVASHNGEVCPASWKPGDKTLTPGVDLVGKI